MQDETREHGESNTSLLIGGSIMLGLGTMFLLINLHILPDWGDIWPLILIIVGVALIIGSFSKKKQTGNN